MPTPEEVELPQEIAEGTPEEQPAEEAPETVPFKVRGEERQISASNLDALANELGTSREAALMWLQTGKDAGSHYSELRQRERELTQRQAEIEAAWQQYQQQQKPAPQQPSYQPQAAPNEDDPIALLRHQNQQLQMLAQALTETKQSIAQREEEWKQFQQQQWEADQATQIESAYSHFADKWKSEHPSLRVPTYEEIEEEAISSGLAQNRRLSWDQVMQKAARNLLWDEGMTAAKAEALSQARKPTAKVVVRGGAQPAPMAKPDTLDSLRASFGDMKLGEIVDGLPQK